MINNNGKLSICMIVKNEEINIKDCLESVRDLGDEIIIVDNGSTDNTLGIVKNLNCKIFDGSGLNLDEARDIYLKEATSEWILIIDADERFEKKDKEKLYASLNNANDDVWGIELKGNQYLGFGKWSEPYFLRVVKNNGLIKYNTSPIHATLALSISEHGKKIDRCEAQLHHIDILIKNRTILKRQRYKNLLINELSKEINADISDIYIAFLALEYISEENYNKAEDMLLEAIQNKTKYSSFVIGLLCRLYIETNQYKKVEKYITNKNMQLLIDTDVLGNYYYYTDIEKCTELYLSQLIKKPSKTSNYINLSFLLKNKDKEKSRNMIKKAFEYNPYLKNKIIYDRGEKPNIFDIQSNIIKPIKNVYDLISELNLIYLIEK